MSRHQSLNYGPNGLHETFVNLSIVILKDLKDFMYKHIYLLGYF